MRAAIVKKFGPPSTISIENDWPVPKISSNQLLIRVKAASVNPVDTYIRSGNFMDLPKLPYSPGMDGAGLVEKVGDGVKKYKNGNRVWFLSHNSGACAEFLAVEEDMVFELPDGVPFAQGSTLGICYMTAYKAIFIDGKAQKSDTILVHGASGGVGLAAIQIAHANGFTVAGTAGTKEGQKIVEENGADYVFDHNKEGYIKQISNAFSPDIVLEMLGNKNMSNDLDLITDTGRICLIGSQGPIKLNVKKTKKMEAHSSQILVLKSTKKEFELMGNEINKLLVAKKINPIVGKERPLEELQNAHEEIMDYSKGKIGKIVINFDL